MEAGSDVVRCQTIFGMHKFELVPITSNGIELLEEDFSGSERKSMSNDLTMEDLDIYPTRSSSKLQVMVTIIGQMDLKLPKLTMGPCKAMLRK